MEAVAKVQEKKQPQQVMALLQQTAPVAIAELDFVKNKFIQNYNACHKGKMGEMMYHRQLVHFKQIITGSDQLKAAEPFSLYACFVTAAVNGYSLDPQDNEVYLLPLAGKAVLWRQTGAHIRRLITTGQIIGTDQAKLVYKGDVFEVENGRVVRHVEKFESETIIAGYIRFILDDSGRDKFFIYRKSDWEAWKKKSKQQSSGNWVDGPDGQPGAAFLRTKITKHACLEKGWAVGITNPAIEAFPVEIDGDDAPENNAATENNNVQDDSFADSQDVTNPPTTVNHSHTDEDEHF